MHIYIYIYIPNYHPDKIRQNKIQKHHVVEMGSPKTIKNCYFYSIDTPQTTTKPWNSRPSHPVRLVAPICDRTSTSTSPMGWRQRNHPQVLPSMELTHPTSRSEKSSTQAPPHQRGSLLDSEGDHVLPFLWGGFVFFWKVKHTNYETITETLLSFLNQQVGTMILHKHLAAKPSSA